MWKATSNLWPAFAVLADVRRGVKRTTDSGSAGHAPCGVSAERKVHTVLTRVLAGVSAGSREVSRVSLYALSFAGRVYRATSSAGETPLGSETSSPGAVVVLRQVGPDGVPVPGDAGCEDGRRDGRVAEGRTEDADVGPLGVVFAGPRAGSPGEGGRVTHHHDRVVSGFEGAQQPFHV